eukprot:Em0002g1027a
MVVTLSQLQGHKITDKWGWHRINIPNNQPFTVTVSNGDAEHDNGAALGEGCDHVALVYQEEVVSTYYSER